MSSRLISVGRPEGARPNQRERCPSENTPRFPTNGLTTEPELIWSALDLNFEPKAVQSLISVHACGDVVIHFGAIRHRPSTTMPRVVSCASSSTRWRALTFHLRASVAQRGSPITVLEDPSNLARLVSVIDRLATATRPHPTSAPQEQALAEQP